jgi:hypothetical protein
MNELNSWPSGRPANLTRASPPLEPTEKDGLNPAPSFSAIFT